MLLIDKIKGTDISKKDVYFYSVDGFSFGESPDILNNAWKASSHQICAWRSTEELRSLLLKVKPYCLIIKYTHTIMSTGNENSEQAYGEVVVVIDVGP